MPQIAPFGPTSPCNVTDNPAVSPKTGIFSGMTDLRYSSWLISEESLGWGRNYPYFQIVLFQQNAPSTSVATSEPLAIRIISGLPAQSETIYAPFHDCNASLYLSLFSDGRSLIFCLESIKAVGVFLFSSAIFHATVVSTASAGLRTTILFSPW